jgi:chromosome segregation ATPase
VRKGNLQEDRLTGASRLKEVEGLRNTRRQELREVPLPNRQDLTPREVGYEEAKGCRQESEHAVAKVHSELKYCEGSIQQNIRLIERLEKGIRALKLTLVEVEEGKYKTSEEELDRLEAESLVWKKEEDSSRKTVHSIDIEVEGLKGQLAEKETQIKKVYGRPPETGFNDLNLALAKLEKERYSLQRQEQEWTLIQKDTVEQERILVDGLKSLATGLNLFEVLADNPFGAASSPHVLNLIFQLAESNNIQMICLTALTEDTIFTYFPAVYSLRLRPFMGKDYMTSKIERGFYQIDPLEEELRRKRQIEFEWE